MLRFALCAALLAVPVLRADDKAEPVDPKAPKARELKVTHVPEGRGGRAAPVKATDAAELAKAVTSKETAEEIAKQVDFKKEYVVVWKWSGSGGDRVSMDASGKEAVFTMKRGLTRDLRNHFKVFALPKKMTYKMGK